MYLAESDAAGERWRGRGRRASWPGRQRNRRRLWQGMKTNSGWYENETGRPSNGAARELFTKVVVSASASHQHKTAEGDQRQRRGLGDGDPTALIAGPDVADLRGHRVHALTAAIRLTQENERARRYGVGTDDRVGHALPHAEPIVRPVGVVEKDLNIEKTIPVSLEDIHARVDRRIRKHADLGRGVGEDKVAHVENGVEIEKALEHKLGVGEVRGLKDKIDRARRAAVIERGSQPGGGSP